MNKILHISNYYPPHTGGIEDVCYNIVSYLSRNHNVQQRVFCFNDSPQTIVSKYEGVEIIRVGTRYKIASQSIAFSYGRKLRQLIKDFQPNIIHFHAPNPFASLFLLYFLSKDTRLIVHWHSDIVAQSIIYPFVKPIENRLLKRAEVIIATSPNYINGSKPLKRFVNKVMVIQNIIDPEKFELSQERRQQVDKIRIQYAKLPIILFVGRHVPYKGLEYLIDAIKNEVSTDCAVIIGGNGPLTDSLKRSAKDTDKIHFVGRIPDEELAAYYYAADIFVFPSITKNEAFGVALAEAMYCNTPAITFTIEGSGVNWVNETGTTGLEVSNSDSTAMGKAIELLLTNEELRRTMANNAKRRIENLFVRYRIDSKIDNLYDYKDSHNR